MQQLQQNATGDDPAKTWEALDQLREALAQTAQQSAETTAQQQQQLASAAQLAEALQAAANQLDEKTLTAAMQTLAARAAQAAAQNAAVAQQLAPELQQALKDGQLNPAQLKELAQALQKGQSALSQRMSKLAQSGAGQAQKNRMINPNALDRDALGNQPQGKGDLADYLKKHAAQKSVSEMIDEWSKGGISDKGDKGEKGGKGGVERGRGDAEMTWSDGTREDGALFKEKILPTAGLSEIQNSELVGLSAAAPTAQLNVAAHGALNGAASGGGSAYTQPVLPRHKGAVERYFKR